MPSGGSLAGRSSDGFLVDVDARDATLYRLIVIGDAVAQLPAAVRDRHPNVPWRSVVGFRNRAVHAYSAMDWTIVWDTATQAVPELRHQIADILARDYPASMPPNIRPSCDGRRSR